MNAADYAAALAEVRKMGLDPATIPHEPPPGAYPVDRLFLDANILFSAAYSPASSLRQ